MTHAQSLRAAAILICTIAGCSDASNVERLGQARSRVELSQNNQVYTLSSALWEQRSPIARAKEAASLSTGALLAGLLDASSAMLDAGSAMLDAGSAMLAANGTQIRATCGVTFISPSYAVTAAHCASEIDLDLNQLVVEMYRPSPAITQGYLSATALSGAFPDFTHGRIDTTQGYLIDRYPCKVVVRCGKDYGTALDCDADINSLGDVALLKCDNRPGDRYGFIDIASADDPAAEVFMPWKHEIYDVDVSDVASDQFLHYVVQSSQSLHDNYHYFGLNTQGVEQNQLMPLVSINFSDGSTHGKVDASDPFDVVTDLIGCHGTSGSGALQLGASGLWQLLGPARYGDAELNDYLCDHIPTLVVGEHLPGSRGLTYAGLTGTQHVYLRQQAEIETDCMAMGPGSTSLFTHHNCSLAQLRTDSANADFANRLVTLNQALPGEFLLDPVAILVGGNSTRLSGFPLVSGQRYRVGLNIGCSVTPCPSFSMSVQGSEVLVLVSGAMALATQPLATILTASNTETAVLAFRAEGNNSIQLGGISLRPDSGIVRFDTWQERLQAALFDLDQVPSLAQPMRFVGDGKQGFAAQLMGNERLLLTRQAIAAGHLWTTQFDVVPPATLTCGFLDASLQVVAQADCSALPTQLDDRASVEARVGFFIQSRQGNPPVTIDNVQLQSNVISSTGGSAGSGGSSAVGVNSGGADASGGSLSTGGGKPGGTSEFASSGGKSASSVSNSAGDSSGIAGYPNLGGASFVDTGATTINGGADVDTGCQCKSTHHPSRNGAILIATAGILFLKSRRRRAAISISHLGKR